MPATLAGSSGRGKRSFERVQHQRAERRPGRRGEDQEGQLSPNGAASFRQPPYPAKSDARSRIVKLSGWMKNQKILEE